MNQKSQEILALICAPTGRAQHAGEAAGPLGPFSIAQIIHPSGGLRSGAHAVPFASVARPAAPRI